MKKTAILFPVTTMGARCPWCENLEIIHLSFSSSEPDSYEIKCSCCNCIFCIRLRD